MRQSRADWNRILEVAHKVGARLRVDRKPGQFTRTIYWQSYRKACALGYHGTEAEWERFIRRRG